MVAWEKTKVERDARVDGGRLTGERCAKARAGARARARAKAK